MISNTLFKNACLGMLFLGLAACGGTSIELPIGSNTEPTTTSTPTPVIPDAKGAVTLNWTPPTENTDGSVLTDLSGYKIYFGSSADLLTQSITISNTGLTEYVIENLTANSTYYFTITAVNSLSVESDYSSIISKDVTG